MSGGFSRRRRPGRRRPRPSRDRTVDLDRYRAFIGDWSDFTAAAARPEPTVFRVRTGRIGSDLLVDRLAAQGYRVRGLDGLPGFFEIEDGPRPVSMTVEHWLGLIYVQQASTGVAAPALAPEPGDRILDLCAAPGGKTTHIAQLMEDRGCLVASEISESRIRGLLGNVYRLGHPNVFALACDGRDFPEGALFDRVLVDAPCSGEGTLRRRAGSPPDQSPSFLEYVTRTQKALLEKAIRLTRPGGVVLYVTCTFAPEENEAVVSDALGRLPVEMEPLDLPVPHAPGVTSFEGRTYDARVEGAARVYPHHFDSGGLFLARLRRLDGDMPDRGGTSEPRSGEGRRDGDGWSSVPALFPGDGGDAPPDAGVDGQARDGLTASEAERRMRVGLEEIRARFGIDDALAGAGWTMRGGRAWMHTVGEWPLEAWPVGRWRAVSVGLRAIDFDSRGRSRPTNDFLRWAGGGSEMLDLDRSSLVTLLGGEPVPVDIERRGPIALGLGGDPVGRGAVTVDGLKSEIPKARAGDLVRILESTSES